jgi:hypothetical protein
MSTSYTTKLGFGKPASGDNSWGNVVNDQVTTLVEEAIAGLAAINTWADAANTHNLTTSNGGSSEARCAILSLTDTGTALSGAGTVVVPDATKLYSVINATGQTITIKTASGTGIAVPTARQLNVICDGTNVVEQGSYSAAAHAATVTSTGLVTANTLKVGSSGAGNMTEVADEDTMSSNSATKLATQQSIKAYVDATGNLHRSEIIRPWDNTDTIQATQHPHRLLANNSSTTIADFDLYGNSATVYQEIQLSLNGKLLSAATSYNDTTLTDVRLLLSRKSTGATGTSIGNCTVADAFPDEGADTDSWYRTIAVAGDQTNKIDSFSYLDDAADGASKKRIVNATYNDGTNRTTIAYNNGGTGTGLFASTGGAVYVSSSGFESAGTYVESVPYYFDNGSSNTQGEGTFQIKEYVFPMGLSVGGSSASIPRKTYAFPKLKVVPDSGGAGNLEMRVKIEVTGSELGNTNGSFEYYALQVDQTNITRT